MEPFASERWYTRRCGAHFKPFLAAFDPKNAPKSVRNVPPGRSSRWPARDAEKQHILVVFDPKMHQRCSKQHSRKSHCDILKALLQKIRISRVHAVCTIDGTLCERALVYPSLRRALQAISSGF
eukprot:gene25049-biopygen4463